MVILFMNKNKIADILHFNDKKCYKVFLNGYKVPILFSTLGLLKGLCAKEWTQK